jgi:malonyl-CoA O-methyltransferase
MLHPTPSVLFEGKSVLDIGAGECAYTALIADELGASPVVALDLMYDRMLPAKQSLPASSVAFVQGSCYELPFRDASFDVVFGDLVLHHLPGLSSVIAEVRRVLRRPGWYVGLEPNFFNPVGTFLSFLRGHSANEYLLWPSLIRKEFRSKKIISVV